MLADAKKVSPSDHYHHEHNHSQLNTTTTQKNQPQEQGLLREWIYNDNFNAETTRDATRNKGRTCSIDSTGQFNPSLHHKHNRFKSFRKKTIKKSISSSSGNNGTPDTVASTERSKTLFGLTDPVQRKHPCETSNDSSSSDDERKPTPIKIDFEQPDVEPNARTTAAQSTTEPFREATNDPSEESKEPRGDQPTVPVPNPSKRMSATLHKVHSSKTVIMNGDIVVCNSHTHAHGGNNKHSSASDITVTSSASSVSKAKAMRRESGRNARAAAALDEKGNELFELGKFDKAMACYKKALKLKRRTFAHLIEDADDDDMEDDLMVRNKDGEAVTDPQALVSMATSINNIGYLRQRSGDATPEETMAAYKKSLRIKRRILGNDSLSVGKTLNNIGSVHYLKRDMDRALPAYHEALEIMKANLGKHHSDVATVMSNIGDVYLAQGDMESSLNYYRMALAIRWEAFGGKSPRVIRLLEKISNLEMGDGMMLAKMNKASQNALASWGDDVASELMVGSGFQAIDDELKDLQEQVQHDIEEVDELERNAKVELLKDKIIIIRGMRDVWSGGSELLDNDSISVLTARSRMSNR
eukprot:jgi/Psemu1/282333/fgenesh1_pg.6_\